MQNNSKIYENIQQNAKTYKQNTKNHSKNTRNSTKTTRRRGEQRSLKPCVPCEARAPSGTPSGTPELDVLKEIETLVFNYI